MTVELPEDLREDSGTPPDFRRPTIIDSADRKTSQEAADIIQSLEESRDTHTEDTRRRIEGR